MSILTMQRTIRSTQRLGQIALTLTRHGFGHFAARIKLRRYIPWFGLFRTGKTLKTLEGMEPSLGKHLVSICEELGPTFVKLGQLLSSRPDIIPPDLMEDLRVLQDRVTPFPTEQAYEIIRQNFKRDAKDLFSEIEPVPLASGSIAQTYVATTRDGQKVVVKVRRPNIDHVVKLDMYLLRRLAINVERHVPELRAYRPTAIVEEFAQTITREMDLLNEASITDRIHEFFKNDPNIIIPAVRWDLTTSQVLTLTFVSGRHFHDVLNDPNIELDRTKLARTILETFVRQVLELGVFHADPHPGNLLIIPPDRIGLVDFGMAGLLDRQRNISFLMLLTASKYRYMDMIVDILAEMNSLTSETDVNLLKRDLAILLDKIQVLPLQQMNFNMIYNEIAALAREHHVILPRDFVMVGKGLVSLGGSAMILDPKLNPAVIVTEKVRDALKKLIGRESFNRELTMAAWHGGLLLKDMPHQIREFSRKLLRGQLTIQTDIPQMDNLIRELDHSSNRLSAAIIVAAVIIGSSLIFNTNVGPHWYGFPLLGLIGYLVAGIMGLWVVLGIMRSGKLS